MKKKILALTLGVLMVASLAGCSKGISNQYITIKQYKGLEVNKVDEQKVTDEDVESAISSQLSTTAVKEKVTGRAAENGDTVNIDYKGSVDGVEFEGGSAEKQDLELGSGQFIGANGDHKSFEEQIVGRNVGDSFDITVQFPADYPNPEVADKVSVFNIKVNEISVSRVPELTDKWVKENSEKSKTVEEYKKETKKMMEENNEKSLGISLQSQALEALVEQTEVKKYPEKDVEKQIKTINEYYEEMAKSYEMEFKDFIKEQMGMSEEDFKKQAKDSAEMTVKRALACDLVAKKQKLIPSDKEYDKEIEKYAEGSGYKDAKEFKDKVGEDVIKATILQQKVGEYLAENSVQVEQKQTDDTTESSDKAKPSETEDKK